MAKFENIFSNYMVTEEDQKIYAKMIKDGQEDQAVDDFIEKYITPYIEKYDNQISDLMKQARSGNLTEGDKNKIIFAIGVLSSGLQKVMNDNFIVFSTIQSTIQSKNIKSVRVKNEILKTTIDEFNKIINDAMSKTTTNISILINEIQRAFSVEIQRLRGLGMSGNELQSELNKFEKGIEDRFPAYIETEKTHAFLKTAAIATGAIKLYKLLTYAPMTIRNTLLNIDRNISEVTARTFGDIVVEYYLRDKRRLKGDAREICQNILSNKINGKSLLALDESTATALGIMTVAQAKATKDYALGYNCRHSIRKLSKSFNDQIRNMINSEAA